MKAACYMVTRGWYGKVVPSIKSMMANGNVDRIYVLIEDDKFPYDLPVIPINVSNQQFFRRDGPNCRETRFSWIVMMRAALHRLLPDLDTVLSIDADTIVLDDLSPLWELPIENYYFAAALEPLRSKGGVPRWYYQDEYHNAGVSLLNLKKLRDGKGDEIIEAINTRPWKFIEQDAMNTLCEGRILTMSSEYNLNDWTEAVHHARIIHYAAVHDWYNRPLVKAFERMEVTR